MLLLVICLAKARPHDRRWRMEEGNDLQFSAVDFDAARLGIKASSDVSWTAKHHRDAWHV
jgi:hypothetical protein